MNQPTPIRTDRARKKPHPALVIASVILAVGLWFVIYAVSGRIVWFW